METFSALLALCAGNSPVTGELPSQRPVTRSFDVLFIWAWTNSWVNNLDTGDLRRHRVHYDVIAMYDMHWLVLINCEAETCKQSSEVGGGEPSIVDSDSDSDSDSFIQHNCP